MLPRKQIRLPREAYEEPGSVWLVSIVTLGRKPVLTTPGFPEVAIESLRFQCAKGDTNLLAYCLMPDHLHLGVAIGRLNLIDLIHDFKSYTATQWRKRTGQPQLWQVSFQDRGIRRSTPLGHMASYVVRNPVTAGLVQEWHVWPWTGGTLIDAGEVSDLPE
jgi:putative transposase